VGSPETVRRRVGELQAAGVGELACWMSFGGLPVEKVRRSMELFAREVMPAFGAAGRAGRADRSLVRRWAAGGAPQRARRPQRPATAGCSRRVWVLRSR